MCPEKERRGHAQYFIHRMQFSGYDQAKRMHVYCEAKRRFEKIMEKSRDGTCPLYRSKFWNQEERKREKLRKKENWFGKKFDTVMFVDNTEKSTLANECQKIMLQSGLKIKVIERSGTLVKDLVTRSYPYEHETCQDCGVCN